MTYNEIARAWNATADEHNQWHNISEEEKVEFAFNFARGITHPGMTLREKLKTQCEYCMQCHTYPDEDTEIPFVDYHKLRQEIQEDMENNYVSLDSIGKTQIDEAISKIEGHNE